MSWDNKETVEQEFPKDRFEHIPVKSEDEAQLIVATRVFQSCDMLFGQARWFGPNDGVLIIPIPEDEQPPLKQEDKPTIAPRQSTVFGTYRAATGAWVLIVAIIAIVIAFCIAIILPFVK